MNQVRVNDGRRGVTGQLTRSKRNYSQGASGIKGVTTGNDRERQGMTGDPRESKGITGSAEEVNGKCQVNKKGAKGRQEKIRNRERERGERMRATESKLGIMTHYDSQDTSSFPFPR